MFLLYTIVVFMSYLRSLMKSQCDSGNLFYEGVLSTVLKIDSASCQWLNVDSIGKGGKVF